MIRKSLVYKHNNWHVNLLISCTMACKLINLLISCTLACKLITCSLSITLNNLWYNLPQVTNVLLAFGYVNSFPKSSYPSNQFLLVVWFDFLRMNSFSSCHKFSMGLASGDSGGVVHQFTPLVLTKLLDKLRYMFRIVILHEAMSIREDVTNEW